MCEQDKLIVKLAERKRFVTITNVTTGCLRRHFLRLRRAVQLRPGPAQCGIASRTCRRARRASKPSTKAPPTLPRLILGLPPDWYAL